MRNKFPSYPAITVLLPVFNGEKYLRQAIDSILNQTFSDFELLIIDDGSTDRTLEIINSYNDSHIKSVRSRKNRGIVYTLNYGIKISRGKYIVRMDADDVSRKDRLERQFRFMEENEEIGICGSWVKIFIYNPIFGITLKFPTTPGEIRHLLKKQNVIQHPSVIMRKDLLVKFDLRYRNKYPHAEDFDLWSRANEHFALANIPEVLLYYRYHPNSVGDTYARQQTESAVKLSGSETQKLSPYLSILRHVARWMSGFS